MSEDLRPRETPQCMQCHQATNELSTTTDDCPCQVCEGCANDNMETYRCGVCGAELVSMYDEGA